MIRAATIALALGLCLTSQLGSAQTSQFKGWYVISSELSTRLAPKNAPLDLDRFLPAEDMEDLLGTWFRFGGEHVYQNGLPNSVNMVIWHVSLSRFSKSIATSCRTPEFTFHPRFLATLKRLCAWPAPEAQSEAVLLEFWLSIMGYNAPEEEFIAWRDFFLHSSYRDRPASETIDAMTLAITMNPHFLLHK